MKRLLLFLILLTVFSVGFCKSFYLDSASVKVTVLDNGLVKVVENITFNFTGCYSVIYREVPLGTAELINYSASASDSFISNVEISDSFFYEFYFDNLQCDKKTSVSLFYYLGNVVDVYDDTSSLHFQFWGSEWDKVERLNAVIVLPSNVSDYWIHNEVFEDYHNVNGNIINYSANNIPSNHWIEAQILFSPLVNSSFIDLHSGSYADMIRNQELIYDLMDFFEKIYCFFVIFLPFAFFYFAYSKHGKELIVEYMNNYEREPPTSDSPAFVKAVLNSPGNCEPGIDGFIATMFDLARRKYLNFTGDEKNVIIKIIKKSKNDLNSYEMIVFNFLEGYANSADEVNWNIMKKKLQSYSDSKSFQRIIKKFNNEVKDLFKKEDYFISKGSKVFLNYSLILFAFSTFFLVFFDLNNIAYFLTLLIYVPFIIGALALATRKNFYGIFILGFIMFQFIGSFGNISFIFTSIVGLFYIIQVIILVILNLFTRKILGKWTSKGRNFDLKWNNFKKFLKDYSLLSEHPPQSIKIWEKFLVYAIVLGVAKNVIKVMNFSVPDFAKRSNMGIIYYYPYFFMSMHSSFAASNVMTQSGGGGFGSGMGGFGGGFGGGGGGAR